MKIIFFLKKIENLIIFSKLFHNILTLIFILYSTLVPLILLPDFDLLSVAAHLHRPPPYLDNHPGLVRDCDELQGDPIPLVLKPTDIAVPSRGFGDRTDLRSCRSRHCAEITRIDLERLRLFHQHTKIRMSYFSKW